LIARDPGYIGRLHMVGSADLVRAWLDGDRTERGEPRGSGRGKGIIGYEERAIFYTLRQAQIVIETHRFRDEVRGGRLGAASPGLSFSVDTARPRQPAAVAALGLYD
jgi:hypothetical protein